MYSHLEGNVWWECLGNVLDSYRFGNSRFTTASLSQVRIYQIYQNDVLLYAHSHTKGIRDSYSQRVINRSYELEADSYLLKSRKRHIIVLFELGSDRCTTKMS